MSNRAGQRKCMEPNCSSKATFKSPGQLEQHVRNIHRHPLLCTWPGCSYTKPFGKQSDLDRHVKTKHHGARDTCPFEDCQAHVDGFSRKDKLQAHLRDKYPMLRCQQSHCRATILDGDQQSHMEQAHGDFECALGSCQSAPLSHFTKSNLKRHLRIHHRLTYDPLLATMKRLDQAPRETRVSIQHISTRKLKDCSICGPPQNFEEVVHGTGIET